MSLPRRSAAAAIQAAAATAAAISCLAIRHCSQLQVHLQVLAAVLGFEAAVVVWRPLFQLLPQLLLRLLLLLRCGTAPQTPPPAAAAACPPSMAQRLILVLRQALLATRSMAVRHWLSCSFAALELL